MLAAGVGLVYYGQLLHTFLPVARPDSLGLFLFLVSVLAPIATNFSPASLIVSAVSALLAWITKPYFALGGVVIGLYMLLAVDWRAGLAYCASSALGAAGIGMLLNRFFEDPVGRRIGDHQDRKILRMGRSLGPQIGNVDVALGIASDHHDVEACHRRARRIGTVRRLRDQTHPAVALTAPLMVTPNHQQTRVLALRASVGLQ